MRINKFLLLSLVGCSALFSCGPKVLVENQDSSKGSISYFIHDKNLVMQAYPNDNYLFTGWFIKDKDDEDYRFESASNPFVYKVKNNVTFQARFEDKSTQSFVFTLKKDKFTEMPTHFSISCFYDAITTDVIVPNTHYGYPVKEIEPYTFRGYSNIQSIMIPSNITIIGDGAFEGCTMNSITIDHDIEQFGAAFTNWTSSQTINIPKKCIKQLEQQVGEYTHITTWNWYLKHSEGDSYVSTKNYCGSDVVKIVAI